MRRRMLLLASVALVVAFAGCRHKCHKWHHKDDCCPAPGPAGVRGPMLLPPAGVPTTPGPAVPGPAPSVLPPGTSGFLPPPTVTPDAGGPKVLLPEPLPGSGMSSRPAPAGPNFLGGPVKPAEAPKPATTAGLPGFTKVKEGLYAGGRPTIDGFDALKTARFRTVIYMHGPGADVAAVKDLATTRDLNFVAIPTTPETLAEASSQFNRAVGDRLNRSAYIFADDDLRAGAVWYLYFRTVDAADVDAARVRAKALGLNDQSEEGKAFWVAIQKVLEK